MPIKLNKSNKNNNNKKILNTSKEIIFNPNDKELFTDENIRKKNDEEIKLSGNNFELVKPEVGVVISNEAKNIKKEGGFEYFKKYNKPSMKEYSILSQNSLNSVSSYMYEMNYNKRNDINIEDSQEYIGYKEEFNENNNPLFQGGYKISSLNSTKNNFKDNNNTEKEKDDKDSITSKRIRNRNRNMFKQNKSNLINSFISYDGIKKNNNRYKGYSGYNSIKLNEDIKSENLKSILNTNDEYDTDRIKHYKSLDNSSYLRRSLLHGKPDRYYKKRRELPIITESNGRKDVLNELINVNEINKFNFRIIKDSNWGDDIHSIQNIRNKSLIKSKDYLHTDRNINVFRRDNSNKNKESNSVFNNARSREKKYNVNILPKLFIK